MNLKKLLICSSVALVLSSSSDIKVAAETNGKTAQEAAGSENKQIKVILTKAKDRTEKLTKEELSTDTIQKVINNDSQKKTAVKETRANTEKASEEKPVIQSTQNTNASTYMKATVKESKVSYTEAQLKLLSCLVYAESGNQSYKGKLAVANVVLNRVKSPLFPSSLTGVIYQKGQFSVAGSYGTLNKSLNAYKNRKNVWEKKAEAESIKAAKAALEGQSATSRKYLFFTRYNKGLESKYPDGVKIGDHYFYNR